MWQQPRPVYSAISLQISFPIVSIYLATLNCLPDLNNFSFDLEIQSSIAILPASLASASFHGWKATKILTKSLMLLHTKSFNFDFYLFFSPYFYNYEMCAVYTLSY